MDLREHIALTILNANINDAEMLRDARKEIQENHLDFLVNYALNIKDNDVILSHKFGLDNCIRAAVWIVHDINKDKRLVPLFVKYLFIAEEIVKEDPEMMMHVVEFLERDLNVNKYKEYDWDNLDKRIGDLKEKYKDYFSKAIALNATEKHILQSVADKYPNSVNVKLALEHIGQKISSDNELSILTMNLFMTGLIDIGNDMDSFKATEKGVELNSKLSDKSTETKSLLLPNLKPYNWSNADKAICEPLFSLNNNLKNVPLVSYGYDTPSTFLTLIKEDENHNLQSAREESLNNLKKIDVNVKEYETNGIKFIVVSESFYSGEKVLDRDFMKSLHHKLNSDLLIIGIPRKSYMFVMNGVQNPDQIIKFKNMVEGYYIKHETSLAISNLLFLVQNASISGIAEQMNTKELTKKKGIFGRFFS